MNSSIRWMYKCSSVSTYTIYIFHLCKLQLKCWYKRNKNDWKKNTHNCRVRKKNKNKKGPFNVDPFRLNFKWEKINSVKLAIDYTQTRGANPVYYTFIPHQYVRAYYHIYSQKRKHLFQLNCTNFILIKAICDFYFHSFYLYYICQVFGGVLPRDNFHM